METPITPITGPLEEQTQPRLTIAPRLDAPDGSVWAFNGTGYGQIVEPWAVEQHIPPVKAHEKLGDVESWCAYVQAFGGNREYLTWSLNGLRAVLDYHDSEGDDPGRCAWIAEHRFQTTRQWQAWMRLADNRARSQKELIETLEELRLDVKQPDAATLVALLRELRANVNVAAESVLEPNGNTRVSFSKNTTTSVDLPPSMVIGIPVLKGHTAPDEHGIDGPVPYELTVLIRVDTVDADKGRLGFRLTIPNADAALEDAVTDRVRKARELLGAEYTLLRAAEA